MFLLLSNWPSILSIHLIYSLSGLEEQNTTLALENRNIKQELAKYIETSRHDHHLKEAVDDYKSQIQFLKQQNDKVTQEKDEALEKLSKALETLNKGQNCTWSVTDYMQPTDLPVEAANYIANILEEKKRSESTVFKLQAEVKRLHNLAFDSKAEDEKSQLISERFSLERELQILNEDFTNINKILDDLTLEHEKCEQIQKDHFKEIADIKTKGEDDLIAVVAQHSKEVEDLKNSHKIEIVDLKCSHKTEIEDLKKGLETKCEEDVIAAVTQHSREVEDMKKAKEMETQDLHKLVKKLEGELFPTANCSCSQTKTIESLQIKINELEGDLWDYPDTIQELKRAKQTIDKLEIKVTDLLEEIDYGHDTYKAKIADLDIKVSELENALTIQIYKEVELAKNTYENKIKELEYQLKEAQIAEAEGNYMAYYMAGRAMTNFVLFFLCLRAGNSKILRFVLGLLQPQNGLGPEETREYLLPDQEVIQESELVFDKKTYETYEAKIKLLEERNTFLQEENLTLAKLRDEEDTNHDICEAKIKELEALLEEIHHHDITKEDEKDELTSEMNANEFTVQIHITSDILKVWNLDQDKSSWMTPMFIFDQIIDQLCSLYRPIPLALEFKAGLRPTSNSNTMNFLNMFYFWKNLRRSPT